jgi:hypothetical protein
MNGNQIGNFQILMKNTDAGADDNHQTAIYQLGGLSGNYQLTLQGFQMFQTGASASQTIVPVQIYSPSLYIPNGNTRYPTFLYPTSDYAKIQGEFNFTFNVWLRDVLELQIRNPATALPFTNFESAILHFRYEKI